MSLIKSIITMDALIQKIATCVTCTLLKKKHPLIPDIWSV